MRKHILLLFLAALSLCSSAFGVAEIGTSGTTYNISEPGSSITTYTSTGQVQHGQGSTLDFTTGWGYTAGSGITGWDYVGTINGCSAVYLGNGWVITCAHVLQLTDYSSSFTLSGSTYSIITGSIQYVVDSSVDLVMFRVSDTISLNSLNLSTSSLSTTNNTNVVMVGYGDGNESSSVTTETWGTSVVVTSDTNGNIKSLLGYSNVDLISKSTTSKAITGDSGGAVFYYNSSTKTWSLAGIMEASGSFSDSSYATYFIGVSNYESNIAAIVETPEPDVWTLGTTALGALYWMRRKRKA